MKAQATHHMMGSVAALLLAAAIAVVADAFILFSLLTAPDTTLMVTTILGHLIVSALFGLAVARLDAEAGVGVLAAVYVALIGPLGALLALLTPLSRRRENKRPGSASSVREAVVDEARPQQRDSLAAKIITGRAYDPQRASVEAFKPLLLRGGTSKRQDVLATMARDFRPSMLPLLAEGLRSQDVGTRTTAATVVRALKERGIVQQDALTASLQAHDQTPHDRAPHESTRA